jgi:addiction module RelE/StbE family toxin
MIKLNPEWQNEKLKTDEIIEAKVENLLQQPLMGVQRDGIPGRLLIIPEISMIVSYWTDNTVIRVMRVLHQKQTFPQE